MRRVLVTVKPPGDHPALDLDLPADLGAGLLARAIAMALELPLGPGEAGAPVAPGEAGEAGQAGAPYRLAVWPGGRLLGPGESLAGAGVWDGGWLALLPERRVPAGPSRGRAAPGPG